MNHRENQPDSGQRKRPFPPSAYSAHDERDESESGNDWECDSQFNDRRVSECVVAVTIPAIFNGSTSGSGHLMEEHPESRKRPHQHLWHYKRGRVQVGVAVGRGRASAGWSANDWADCLALRAAL